MVGAAVAISNNTTTTTTADAVVSNQGSARTEYVHAATDAASRRHYDAELAAQGTPVKLSLTAPAGSANRLDLLFASTGIKNYGPYAETIRVGIVSAVSIDGVKLTNYSSVVGLNGEAQSVYTSNTAAGAQGAVFAPLSKTSAASSSSSSPVTWYRANFTTPHFAATPESEQSTLVVPLALDISATSLVKGAVWVNGFMLGRYWNIVASSDDGTCGK